MKTHKLKLIEGGRDKLEASLTKALFGESDQEIEKQIAILNSIESKKPQLSLIKTSKDCNNDS